MIAGDRLLTVEAPHCRVRSNTGMNTPANLDLILRRFEEPDEVIDEVNDEVNDEVRELPFECLEIITSALRNYWRLLAICGVEFSRVNR